VHDVTRPIGAFQLCACFFIYPSFSEESSLLGNITRIASVKQLFIVSSVTSLGKFPT
jgi:hypothetical protein